MKQLSLLLGLVLLMSTLCACQIPEQYQLELPFDPPSSSPTRMIEQVVVDLHPADPLYHRVYSSEKSLTALVHMMRRMELGDPLPDGAPLDDVSSYYSFTVTYANGSECIYRMLSHQYLRARDDRWYEISRRSAELLTQFILTQPGDDATEATLPQPVAATEPTAAPPDSASTSA